MAQVELCFSNSNKRMAEEQEHLPNREEEGNIQQHWHLLPGSPNCAGNFISQTACEEFIIADRESKLSPDWHVGFSCIICRTEHRKWSWMIWDNAPKSLLASKELIARKLPNQIGLHNLPLPISSLCSALAKLAWLVFLLNPAFSCLRAFALSFPLYNQYYTIFLYFFYSPNSNPSCRRLVALLVCY